MWFLYIQELSENFFTLYIHLHICSYIFQVFIHIQQRVGISLICVRRLFIPNLCTQAIVSSICNFTFGNERLLTLAVYKCLGNIVLHVSTDRQQILIKIKHLYSDINFLSFILKQAKTLGKNFTLRCRKHLSLVEVWVSAYCTARVHIPHR